VTIYHGFTLALGRLRTYPSTFGFVMIRCCDDGTGKGASRKDSG
jgi:hypothetical protein